MPDIPDIEIPTIEIRPIPEPHVLPPPVTQNLAPRPIYQVPGCARVHRDAQLNPSLLRETIQMVLALPVLKDKCLATPLWTGTHKKLQIIEPQPIQNQQQEEPQAKQKQNPPPRVKQKDESPKQVDCPPAGAAEIGTLSSDGRKILKSYCS